MTSNDHTLAILYILPNDDEAPNILASGAPEDVKRAEQRALAQLHTAIALLDHTRHSAAHAARNRLERMRYTEARTPLAPPILNWLATPDAPAASLSLIEFLEHANNIAQLPAARPQRPAATPHAGRRKTSAKRAQARNASQAAETPVHLSRRPKAP